MRFILTCGGTAGHINPALAVAGRLKELLPGSQFLFLGAEGKMEMELVPREGYEIKPLRITNISRGKSLAAVKHNLDTLKNVIAAEKEARQIIRAFQPDAVIGTGGYVCYPVLMAASKLGIPTAVHESNAVPGLTTKMLAKHVNCVMVGFEDSKQYYSDAESVTVTGTPVRGEFACHTRESAKQELGIAADMPLVVSVWGSLGARHMNEIVTDMLPFMQGQQEFHMIHSIGTQYQQEVSEKLNQLQIDPADCGAELRSYIYDMPRVMAAADLILCRAGASTLAELSYMGKPVVIVPSPNVTNNHQEKNARVLEAAGGAKVLLEGEFDAYRLLSLVRELLADPAALEDMARAMEALSVPDAADKICDRVLEICRS